MFLLVLLVLGGVVLYFMKPEERLALLHKAAALRHGLDLARRGRVSRDDPFYAELRARTGRPLVTCCLAAALVAVFVMMLAGRGALADPATLVAWGASFGPRTTLDERWRLFTSMFVHRGVLHVLVNVAALIQLGIVVERVVGPFTFGLTFFTAGVLGTIMSAAAAPMSIVSGSAGAVFGVYGLLFAAVLRGWLQRSAVRIPLSTLARLIPVTLLFLLYCVATGEPSITAKVGLCAGLVSGITLTRSIPEYGARLRRFAALGAATAGVILLSAMSLRAVTDVRPEIAAVVADEERAAASYDAAVAQFRTGRVTARDLAQLIDGTILPGVQRARARVTALAHVPPDDVHVVADAQEYLRLREESWRVRAAGLRASNAGALKQAERIERASLQVFDRLTLEPAPRHP
jgi:rhomboid protease GluP